MTSFYNSLLPTPTSGGSNGSNYTFSSIAPQTYRQFTQRMDYAISESNHVFFRWTRTHYNKESTGFTIGDVDLQVSPKWIELGALGYDHVLSPTTNLVPLVHGAFSGLASTNPAAYNLIAHSSYYTAAKTNP
jgi:hypothetical protein